MGLERDQETSNAGSALFNKSSASVPATGVAQKSSDALI